MSRPLSGSMVHWRYSNNGPFRFGYVTYAGGHDLLRMGSWNGDATGGCVVKASEIEWEPYRP